MLGVNGPDFIGVGMERSATGWMFKMLAAHPDIWVPPLPSLHYFDRIEKIEGEDPSRFRRYMLRRIADRKSLMFRDRDRLELSKNSCWHQLLWDWQYFTGRRTNDWYEGLFDKKYVKNRISGEVTSSYAHISPSLVKRVSTDFPRTKIILMLRDPYQRLRSELFYYFKHHQNRPFYTVEDAEMEEYLMREDVLEKSSPTRVLSSWSRHFDEDRLFVGVQSHDLSEYVEDFLKEIYGFLGVDKDFLPPAEYTKPKVNAHLDIDPEDYLPKAIDTMIREFAEDEMKQLRVHYPHIAQIWDAPNSS